MLMNIHKDSLPNAAQAVRNKLEDSNGYLPSELAEKIDLIRSRWVKTGVVVPAADSRTLTVPTTGRLIHVRGYDVPQKTGYLVAATWSEGADPSAHWGYAQLGTQTRYTNTSGSVTFSGLTTTVAEGNTVFDTANSSRFFAAGAKYVWTCYDWPMEQPVAVYDVGAAAGTVYLVLMSRGDGSNTAFLLGSGATVDYSYSGGEVIGRPWEDYVGSITEIRIGAGVTSLGAYLFAKHSAVRQLHFEDSGAVTHLGDRCFWRCSFGGEFRFPNLADESLSRAFACCDRLRGLALSEKVTELGKNALNQCLELRKVTGLGMVEKIGQTAFAYTPKLRQTDLDPQVVTEMGTSAFHISSAMAEKSAADWPSASLGENVFAGANWSKEQLEQVRSIPLPNVLLPVAPLDSLSNYAAGEDYLYSLDYDGEPRYLEYGCDVAGMAAIYNLRHGTGHSIGSWWTEVILPADDLLSAEQGLTPIRGGGVAWKDIVARVAAAQGLELKTAIYANATVDDPSLAEPNVTGMAFCLPEIKAAIAQALQEGNIPFISFRQTDSFKHAVYIVGANAASDQLLVMDATKFSDGMSRIYAIALEELISAGVIAHVDIYGEAEA